MSARSARAGPKGHGHNAPGSKEEAAAIKRAMESLKDIKLRKEAFNAKMKRRHEKEVAAPFKELGIKMKHVAEDFQTYLIETGTDKNAVDQAAKDRAERLDATRRIYAALHDGGQLDWVELQKTAERARLEAEADAGEEEDGGDEEKDD